MTSMNARLTARRSWLIAALLCAGPACAAPLYKWVDQSGRTNYSSQPPDSAARLMPIENNLSVYTPDDGFKREVVAFRQQLAQERREERRYDGPRGRESYTAPSSGYTPAYGNVAPGVVYGGRLRAPRFAPPQQFAAPGTSAGNVVGMNGFIPGNSASAPAGILLPRRGR